MDNKFDWLDKIVLVRIDCDVDLKKEKKELVVDEDYRLRCLLPTINFLLEHGVKQIILIGHIGRPEGKVVEDLRLEPVAQKLIGLLNSKFKAQNSKSNKKFKNFNGYQVTDKVVLLENIRFDKGEEENDAGFAKELADLGDVYVNEAFGVSHRQHASIVGIQKYLPSFYGLQFQREIENLTWLKEKAPRPLVFVLGGSKEDKLDYLEFLARWADTVLVGGKLPLLIKSTKFEAPRLQSPTATAVGGQGNPKQYQISNFKYQNNNLDIPISQFPNIILADLTLNGLDIDQASIDRFKEVISKASTVVWAGPMGKYEEPGNETGTYEIARATASCPGKKFAGGGDTHRIISRLNLWDKFDFVSVGGGAMLRFLSSSFPAQH